MPKQFKTARQISHHGRPLACPYRKSRYSAGSSPRTFQNSGKSPTCFAAGTHMLRWRAVQGEQPVIERHDIAGQPGNGHVNVQAQ